MPCPFCDAAGTDDVIVMAAPDALMPGHTIVAPRAHATAWSGLSPDVAQRWLGTAARVAAEIEKEHAPRRCYAVLISEAVPHLHLHLLPARQGDAPLGPFVFRDWAAAIAKR